MWNFKQTKKIKKIKKKIKIKQQQQNLKMFKDFCFDLVFQFISQPKATNTELTTTTTVKLCYGLI